jgi:hypothetical protein
VSRNQLAAATSASCNQGIGAPSIFFNQGRASLVSCYHGAFLVSCNQGSPHSPSISCNQRGPLVLCNLGRPPAFHSKGRTPHPARRAHSVFCKGKGILNILQPGTPNHPATKDSLSVLQPWPTLFHSSTRGALNTMQGRQQFPATKRVP